MDKIIQICSQNDYQHITNFEWYITVLVELSRTEGGTKHGKLIAKQMMDVAIRVSSIRSFAVSQMALLVENHTILLGKICTLIDQWLNELSDILCSSSRIRFYRGCAMALNLQCPASKKSKNLHFPENIFQKSKGSKVLNFSKIYSALGHCSKARPVLLPYDLTLCLQRSVMCLSFNPYVEWVLNIA